MHRLLANLPKQHLQILCLSHAEFQNASVEDYELKLDGKMFDVAFTEMNENIIFVYGLFDGDEDQLLTSLKDEARKQTENTQTNQLIKQFLSLQFLPTSSQTESPHNLHTIQTNNPYTHLYLSLSFGVESPPPRIA